MEEAEGRGERSAAAVLCVTVGAPASGKSSLCRRIVEGKKNGWEVVHVELDALVEGVGVGVEKWHEARERMLEKAREELGKGRRLVMVDDNMNFRSMRKPFVHLAEEVGAGFVVVYLQCTREESIRRNKSREEQRRVTLESIDRIFSSLEVPPPSDKVLHGKLDEATGCFLARDSLVDLLDLFWPMVDHSSAHPLCNERKVREIQADASRSQLSTSERHHLDLEMRSFVAQILATVSEDERQNIAKFSSVLKKKLLASPGILDPLVKFREDLSSFVANRRTLT